MNHLRSHIFAGLALMANAGERFMSMQVIDEDHYTRRRRHRSVRRLPADDAGLELHGAALSPTRRNSERGMEIP
jgi:hypothetical protein